MLNNSANDVKDDKDHDTDNQSGVIMMMMVMVSIRPIDENR